ncbi:hypothetical protein [Kitasatospora sp. McL0602]|uniref:hypothetical protein n=1 Tax=Kitasatospora sp. McL0602 TaxID=3439530 RepID=UPI003F8A9925
MAFFAVLSAVVPITDAQAAVPGTVTIQSLDLHDGMVLKDGSTYYLYGTEYGCGFRWQDDRAPWCGFGVSTATSLGGPWSLPQLLFPPGATDPYSGLSWQNECVNAGCFNPRMVKRSGWGADDGAWVLWFNSPSDYNWIGANAYNVMGCNSPAGPCGPTAGAPYGSYRKPPLYTCYGNGDFGLAVDTASRSLVVVCTMPDSTLSVEQIDLWGTSSARHGAAYLAGLDGVEGPGIWYEPATGSWFGTYSDPFCGYCTGTATGYMTAESPLGPWSAPVSLAAGGPPERGRRDISATSCGGQPRTVSVLDGQAWQGIDLWTGQANETKAGLHFEPLSYQPPRGTAGDGGLWHPPFADFRCTDRSGTGQSGRRGAVR